MWVQFFLLWQVFWLVRFYGPSRGALCDTVANATETFQWTHSSGNCSGFSPDSLFNPEYSGYQNSGKDIKFLISKAITATGELSKFF
jgi:hypothetical protein